MIDLKVLTGDPLRKRKRNLEAVLIFRILYMLQADAEDLICNLSIRIRFFFCYCRLYSF